MVGVRQDKSERTKYAWEEHSHPELGVMGAGRSGEQESWLGTHVFRWFVHMGNGPGGRNGFQYLGLQMLDYSMELCSGVATYPDKYINATTRSRGRGLDGLRATWHYPYSMTNGFYFRTTFGYGGDKDLTVADQTGNTANWTYLFCGLGGSDTNSYTSRFIGVVFGDSDFNAPKRPGGEAIFLSRNNGEETSVPALTMRNYEEGHVWTLEIETLQVNQIRLTLTDLNNGDTASHTFDSSVDGGVPDSDRFGSYDDPITLRPWWYSTDSDWRFCRWDSVESAYAPWERYEAE